MTILYVACSLLLFWMWFALVIGISRLMFLNPEHMALIAFDELTEGAFVNKLSKF